MDHEHPTKITRIRPKNTDELFLMLRSPFRRQIIWSLANGEWKTGVQLNQASGKSGPTYRRDLTELCNAGILVKKDDPKDRRQPVFSLSPHIRVRVNANVTTVDVGCCMLRR